MAKGKIITSTDNEHGIVQSDSGKQIPYTQPFSKELMLQPNSVVRFDVVKDDKGNKTAVNVELYKKGGITTGKDNDTGMIMDANFGRIPVATPMTAALGITDGALVKYDLLKTDSGMVAVYVRLAPVPDPDESDSTKNL